MGWLKSFFSSSIGQKIIMSLTGLFLILFLVVHLIGNLQLLYADQGEAFNLYADFMTTNPLIKFTSYGLYFFILLHAIKGIAIWMKNRSARGDVGYRVKKTRVNKSTRAGLASNMGWLGVVILIFLLIHMYQFWFKMKMGVLPMVEYDGQTVKNLYAPVYAAFTNIGFVIFYVVSMVFLAAHLRHGFQSSFQTLGVKHMKMGSIIELLGKAYSILIPAGFALIPIYFFLKYA